MPSMNSLALTERVKALQAMAEAAADEHGGHTDMLAEPGRVGNRLPTPPLALPHTSRAPAGWEPRVTYGPNGLPAALYSPALPANLSDSEALTEALTILNAMVPPGYWARLDEMRLDEAGWNRKRDTETGTGTGEAFTAPVRRYKWKIEPEPTLDDRAASMSESEWRSVVADVKTLDIPPTRRSKSRKAVALVVPLGDLQVGQHDGDNVNGLLARIAAYPVFVKAELDRLATLGIPVSKIIIPSLGDIVEGTVGFYSSQPAQVKLDRRSQEKMARRIWVSALEKVAELGLPMEVPVVPGNHGQNRNSSGKMQTGLEDNADIAIMEMVAEILSRHPVLAKQVEFHFPLGHEQSLTLDTGWGYAVTYAHGHAGGNSGSGSATSKQQGWWARMALANMDPSAAKYLVTGHFHSGMFVTMPGGRAWIQIPAMCSGNHEHFSEFYGLNGKPGMLSWTFGPDGLDNWRLHELPHLDEVAGLQAATSQGSSGKNRTRNRRQRAAVA